MSLATAFVLTIAAACSYLIDNYLLLPLELGYLRIISFILVIAGAVQFTELMVRRLSPLLHQVLGIYLPLITTNCAVLGIALLTAREDGNLLTAIAYGLGAGLGFGLVMILFAGLRERLETAAVPAAFRGPAITLLTAGIMSMVFLGFSGLTRF
jgi:electron transport complex protein RnfA